MNGCHQRYPHMKNLDITVVGVQLSSPFIVPSHWNMSKTSVNFPSASFATLLGGEILPIGSHEFFWKTLIWCFMIPCTKHSEVLIVVQSCIEVFALNQRPTSSSSVHMIWISPTNKDMTYQSEHQQKHGNRYGFYNKLLETKKLTASTHGFNRRCQPIRRMINAMAW